VHAQRIGIKYFEDMKIRIPRAEVAAIEALVRAEVLDILACREAPDADSLFCRAVGRCEHPCMHACTVLPRSACATLLCMDGLFCAFGRWGHACMLVCS
jgi:hypothetical protein